MSGKAYVCSRCFKRCRNAGALKIHMKTHEKSEPKSGSLLKWIKCTSVKIKTKPKKKTPIELKPIKKSRPLKLQKKPVRDPSVVPRPVLPRPPKPPRRPRLSRQEPIDISPFAAPPELVHPDLDKRSPQFRIAHVQHFRSLKSDYPVLDKTMYHGVNSECLGVKKNFLNAKSLVMKSYQMKNMFQTRNSSFPESEN